MRKRDKSRSSSPSRQIANAEQIVSGGELLLPLVKRVGVVRSQNASRITWHAHEHYELLFLLDGATSYEFADGRTVELPGGHFLVIRPGLRHRGLHDVRQPVRLCGIQFDSRPKRSVRHTPFTLSDLQKLNRQFSAGVMQPYRMNQELRRLIRSLLQRLANPGPTEELFVASLRLSVCATLLEVARQLANPRSLGANQAVASAIALMDSRLAEPLSMDALAAAAHCSRARMFHLFKETTGLTPNDYLQRLRIERAKSALTTTTQSVTGIALGSGFSSSQYFSTVFRKYTSSTPLEFRLRETK